VSGKHLPGTFFEVVLIARCWLQRAIINLTSSIHSPESRSIAEGRGPVDDFPWSVTLYVELLLGETAQPAVFDEN